MVEFKLAYDLQCFVVLVFSEYVVGLLKSLYEIFGGQGSKIFY